MSSVPVWPGKGQRLPQDVAVWLAAALTTSPAGHCPGPRLRNADHGNDPILSPPPGPPWHGPQSTYPFCPLKWVNPPGKPVLSSPLSGALKLQWGLGNGHQAPRWVKGASRVWPAGPVGGCRTPGCLLSCLSLWGWWGPPWWPPSEGLSADNQGTDSKRRRKKGTQAPDRILIFWGGMSKAGVLQQRPCICSQGGEEGRRGEGEEGRRGPALGTGEGGGQDGLFWTSRA